MKRIVRVQKKATRCCPVCLSDSSIVVVVKDYRTGQFYMLIHGIRYREVPISIPKRGRSRTGMSVRRDMMKWPLWRRLPVACHIP